MITVYFDANFYVWLGRELDNDIADHCIAELNALQVRHVVSLPLVQELFSSAPRPDANRLLHARVTQLAIPPLELLLDFTWDALLGPPQVLDQFAKVLRWGDDLATLGHSHGLIAAKPLTEEQQGRWNQANPQFANMVRDENGQWDRDKAFAFARSQIEFLGNLGLVFDQQAVMEELNRPEPNPLAIRDHLLGALGEETVAKLEEEKKLQQSVTASDSRPLDLTLGTAAPKQRKRLANTLRDADHMALFVEHADKIDFLEVDGAQMQQILKTSPQHRLAELGLEQRCFTASTLQEVVQSVSRLVGRRGGVT